MSCHPFQGRRAFERQKRSRQEIPGDMVQQYGELLRLPACRQR